MKPSTLETMELLYNLDSASLIQKIEDCMTHLKSMQTFCHSRCLAFGDVAVAEKYGQAHQLCEMVEKALRNDEARAELLHLATVMCPSLNRTEDKAE